MKKRLRFFEQDAYVAYDFGELLLEDGRLGVDNTTELAEAEYQFQYAELVRKGDDTPPPEDFVSVRLALPDQGFAPDCFAFGRYDFVSRRFRYAPAQPKTVVQFVPIDLVAGGEQARAQDYRLTRLLACQPAMDLLRSDCELAGLVNHVTGPHFVRPKNIERLDLLENLSPRTGIFRMDELPTRILVTDEVAARVLRGGCTGMEFSDPSNRQRGMRIDRSRTVEGVAESRVHFLE